MKETLILFLFFGIANCLYGQSYSEILVINSVEDIIIPDSNLIKTISIKRKILHKSLTKLIEQAVDSTKDSRGNCLQITYFDTNEVLTFEKWEFPDYLRANIFNISEEHKKELRNVITKNELKRDSLLENRNTSKDVEISLGFQFSSFNLENNTGFIREAEGDFEGYLNFFFHLNRVFRSKKDDRFNYRLGIGAAREYLSFYPLVTLKEAGISSVDSIRVGEVGNWEYQFLIPFSISYEFPNLIKKGYGLRFFVGFENRIRIHRINTESTLVRNYSFVNDFGEIYENEDLAEKANDLYSGFINPYSLQINFGIGFLPPEIGSGGIKFTNMLVTSFKKGQDINTQFGLMFYLEIPLFDLKKR